MAKLRELCGPETLCWEEAHDSSEDPYLALLEYQSTQLSGVGLTCLEADGETAQVRRITSDKDKRLCQTIPYHVGKWHQCLRTIRRMNIMHNKV